MMYTQTYEKSKGSKGLITYEKHEIKLKNEIIKHWQTVFIDENTVYIDGPVLIPIKYLQTSGHLSKHNTDHDQIYLVGSNLALRPETCATIFAYYKSKYGLRATNVDIAQVGKSFRNERSTRNLAYRLNEFYQLQIECMESVDISLVDFVFNNITYKVYPKFKILYTKVCQFFEQMNLAVHYEVIHERAFYSKLTIDIFLYDGGKKIEVGCLNDRGTHDISKNVNVSELSIGLHRLIIYKLYYNK